MLGNTRHLLTGATADGRGASLPAGFDYDTNRTLRVVSFAGVIGAATVHIEISDDNGSTWTGCGVTFTSGTLGPRPVAILPHQLISARVASAGGGTNATVAIN